MTRREPPTTLDATRGKIEKLEAKMTPKYNNRRGVIKDSEDPRTRNTLSKVKEAASSEAKKTKVSIS